MTVTDRQAASLAHRLARRPGCSRRDLLRATLALAATSIGLPMAVRGQSLSRFVEYPFQLGVGSGYPTPDGISLWTRLAPMPLAPDGGIPPDEWVTVTWQVAEDEGFGRIVREGRVRAVQELAHSVHVDVRGLQADRGYHYRFLTDTAASPVGRTRTAPAAGADPAALRLAVASCQHFEQGFFTPYRHMLADRAELVVFLGDYIYESSWGDELVRRHRGPEPYDLDGYRVRHAQYKTDPDLQAMHAAVPWLLTWDDHEVDNDSAGAFSEHGDPRFLLRRAAAYQAYYEHMPLPRRMLPQPDGSMRIHTHVDFGLLARVYMLDDRQYRTAQPCPDPYKGGGSTDVDPEHCPELQDPEQTLLGIEQERWLAGTMDASRARWNILAQQTLMTPMDTAEGPGRKVLTDSWDGYPRSREQVHRLFEREGLRNPIVVGGDIHANVVTNVRRDPWAADSPVLAAEVCGTSLTAQGWPQERYEGYLRDNPHLLLGRSDRRGYALFELGRDRCQVRLRTVDSVKTRTSSIQTLAQFVVHDGRRGIEPA
ncbi:MAG TPA: alkaline phosphatase D family protein [Xanthomonadaceae bacterium]|nr:alkaline phosphatase D family protein [Xanthomonadaceae bacterium]